MATISEVLSRFDALIDTSSAASSKLKAGFRIMPLFQDIRLHPQSWLNLALEDLWYQGDQDGRTTRNYHAVVLASEEILQVFHHLNTCKADFKNACISLKKDMSLNSPKFRDALAKRHPSFALALATHGLARIHLKQCYRQFPILKWAPSKISFSWYQSGRSITRISAKNIKKALDNFDTHKPHIQRQLALLAQFPEDAAFAKVQSQAPLLRANVLFQNNDDLPSDHCAFNVALPILMSDHLLTDFPEIIAPKESQPTRKRIRALRSDCRIEAIPFLPSLRIHRYLD